jgi:hypothetical protein
MPGRWRLVAVFLGGLFLADFVAVPFRLMAGRNLGDFR